MTKAQELNITKFPYHEYDSNGREIYFEDSYGYWYKCRYDSNGKETYYEESNGFWEKYQYDSNGNLVKVITVTNKTFAIE